jgi:hypothetical protein
MTHTQSSILVCLLRPCVVAASAVLAVPAWCETSPATGPGTSVVTTSEETSPYTIGAIETVMHDSNVFRIQDGLPVTPPASRADWISTTGLIGSIDQAIGRERLKGSAELDLNRFKDNTQLNSNSHSFNIEGDWATVGRLQGELGYANSEQLYRYNLEINQALTDLNKLHTDSGFARFHLGEGTRLSFDLAFNALNLTYSADVYKPRDLRRWDGVLGANYSSSADLKFLLAYRHTQGEYPNYVVSEIDSSGQPVNVLDPDRFTNNSIDFGVDLTATGASTLNARVSVAKEEHSVITTRSFNYWSVDGKWVWQATGRSQFTLDLLRDNDAGSTESALFVASADARLRTAVSGVLDYELTGKTKMHLSATYAHRDLDSSFSGGNPQSTARGTDNLWTAGLGFDYYPTRSIQLGCTASRERRTTSGDQIDITYPYSATVVSCTGQLAFD